MHIIALNILYNEFLGLYYPKEIRTGIGWKKLNYVNNNNNNNKY